MIDREGATRGKPNVFDRIDFQGIVGFGFPSLASAGEREESLWFQGLGFYFQWFQRSVWFQCSSADGLLPFFCILPIGRMPFFDNLMAHGDKKANEFAIYMGQPNKVKVI